MSTLGEYMPSMDSTASGQDKDFDLMQSGGQPTKAERQETDAIRSSAEAYRTLNTTLGGFYEQPQQGESSEDAELRKRLDELEASMMQQESKRSNMDEQVALMEKSYQLAAKYMPGGNANAASPSSAETATEENKEAVTKGKKAKITPVRQVQRRVVSSLNRPMSNRGVCRLLLGKGFGKVQYRHRERWCFRQKHDFCLHPRQPDHNERTGSKVEIVGIYACRQ